MVKILVYLRPLMANFKCEYQWLHKIVLGSIAIFNTLYKVKFMVTTNDTSRVLVIDDAPIDNYIIEYLLKKINGDSKIMTVQNGKIALDRLKELSAFGQVNMPQYIFVDIHMPVMNGWEFLAEYRKLNFDFRKTKVYILTSSVFKSDFTRSLAYPFLSGFLCKPLTLTKLHELFDTEN